MPISPERDLHGHILTPDGWVFGRLRFDALIVAVEPLEVDGVPNDAPRILPGFVDLHVHGGGGGDVMDGEHGLRLMTAVHARHGTTSLVATTVTAPEDELLAALGGIRAVMEAPADGEARVLGAHLEGPFISPDVLGAQPPFAREPDIGLADRLLEAAPVLIMTVAPELAGAGALADHLRARGVRVQLGHTACTAETGRDALAAGAGITHLYNAMSGLHHRAPGLVGAAMAEAEAVEIILDFLHVSPLAAKAALRAIPRLYGITDAMSAAAMPHGSGYRLGRHVATSGPDGVRLADGTLAGSALTMDAALRNFLALGCDLADAARRLSTIPADELGLMDRGRLVEGAQADVVVVDEEGWLEAVYVGGAAVDDVAGR